MPLFSVTLLFSLQVEARDSPEPLLELAVHILSAANESEAKLKGQAIGKAREASYRNPDGETVRDTFKAIVGVQSLIDDRLFDGMEVASWLFREGEHLVLDQGGVVARSA